MTFRGSMAGRHEGRRTGSVAEPMGNSGDLAAGIDEPGYLFDPAK